MTDEFGDCAGMPDTYRGWKVGYDGQNLRQGGRCWLATSPDYGPLWEDNEKRWASTGEALEAATREELIAAIDAWMWDHRQRASTDQPGLVDITSEQFWAAADSDSNNQQRIAPTPYPPTSQNPETEFSTDIKAEAERLWRDACVNQMFPYLNMSSITRLALCRLLVATGFKPPVDPIEAKAREIVAESLEARSWSAVAKLVRSGDSYTLCHGSKNDIDIAKAGILAGMEMGK